MKLVPFILLLLSVQILAQLELSSTGCTDKRVNYTCTTLKDDKCMVSESFDDINSVVYLMSCDKEDTCYPQENEIGICYKRKYLYFDGESCYVNPECHSHNCTKGRCVGVPDGGDCSSDYACLNDSYCREGKCDKIAKPDGECKNESGCPIGYSCGKASPKDVAQKCIKNFSIETGQYTSNRLYCKKGFAVNLDTANQANAFYNPTEPAQVTNFVCAESKLVSGEKCNENTDCIYEINVGTGNPIRMKGLTCICTANGDAGYCQIATDNPLWTRWLELYAQTIDEGLSKTEHVVYHRTRGWGNPNLIQTEMTIERFEKFKSADDCAMRYLTGAESLKVSLLSLLLLALIAL